MNNLMCSFDTFLLKYTIQRARVVSGGKFARFIFIKGHPSLKMECNATRFCYEIESKLLFYYDTYLHLYGILLAAGILFEHWPVPEIYNVEL